MFTRHHWIAAVMLAALICCVSFGKEAKVETNDQNFLALCKDPEATPEAIEALLKAGADVAARRENGGTALMSAAANNSNPEVIQVLLRAGADSRARRENGWTALMWAARNGHTATAQLLVDCGCDIDAKDSVCLTPPCGHAHSTPK